MNVLVCRWDRVTLEAVLDRGASVTLVFDEWEAANRGIDQKLLDRVDRHYVIRSFDALDELAQLAVDIRSNGVKIDRLLSLSEFSQFGAAYLAQLLGLALPAVETSVLMRDKRAMKDRAQQAGIRCARYVSLSTRDIEGSVRQVEQELGFPVIVKPAAGLGSVDTFKAEDAAQLTEALREAGRDATVKFLMAEQVLDGDEYHVDAVWADGKARVFGVSRYLRPRMTVTTPGRDNGSILLPRDREAALYEEIEHLHERINTAFGITDEITHLEIFRRADGELWFSEMATRFAGGAIPESFGPQGADLRELWIAAALGEPGEELPVKTAPYPYIGWINLAPAGTGRILEDPSDELISRFPYVLKTVRSRPVGSEIGELHPSVWCTLLVLGADSEAEFRRRAAELEAALLPSYVMGQ
ncbi:ATP-grasp domain-containing protein [Streptomyces sp. PCS3-D2]|uniref:ATP-grasp domain-containing protein n=1 Tax=Streptomyces sp. PCS3-D2 TaxID=1460244 RepID=UPI0004500DC0|nr:ATP-grasp domain-containing protein [Streptomyces sp. PCS3-D2]WKV72879.1 ATP-grasp domain-containing protein [Streptomyces sp. PCS3-D2]